MENPLFNHHVIRKGATQNSDVMNTNLLYLLIISLITACGCQQNLRTANTKSIKEGNKNVSAQEEEKTQIPLESMKNADSITLKVDPKRFQSSATGKARLILTNSTSESILTGTRYFIEYYENSDWRKLNLLQNIVFDDVAFQIKPLTSKEFIVNLQLVPHKYIPGKYRLGKEITHLGRKSILTAEFIVE